MDHYRIVDALLSKIVERGCTPGEAEAAKAKAEELIQRHNLDRSRLGRKQQSFRTSFASFGDIFTEGFDARMADDFLRRATRAYQEAQARTNHEQEAKRKREAAQDARFSTIDEMARSYLQVVVDVTRGKVVEAKGVGMPYYEILRRVKGRFPAAKTSVDTLRWYESQLRREGKQVPKRWDPNKRGKGPNKG